MRKKEKEKLLRRRFAPGAFYEEKRKGKIIAPSLRSWRFL